MYVSVLKVLLMQSLCKMLSSHFISVASRIFRYLLSLSLVISALVSSALSTCVAHLGFNLARCLCVQFFFQQLHWKKVTMGDITFTCVSLLHKVLLEI